jgi:hypothetical protein
LPAELRPLAFAHQRVVYDALLTAATDTLKAFALNPKHLGATLGMSACCTPTAAGSTITRMCTSSCRAAGVNGYVNPRISGELAANDTRSQRGMAPTVAGGARRDLHTRGAYTGLLQPRGA